MFVDADSHPSPELFADVARAIRGGRHLAGGSTLAFEDGRGLLRAVAWGWNTLSRLITWAAGSFIFCEASAFRQVGGFSLRFYAAEEIELSRRLKRLARQRRQWLEILTFAARTILGGGRTLRSAGGCYAWYDGRR